MIAKKNNSNIFLPVSFFLLVFSQSITIQTSIVKNIAEYLGVFLLAYQLILNQRRKKLFQKNKIYCIIVFLGMTIGLVLQKMKIVSTLKALVPAILFSMLFTMSDGLIDSLSTLRKVSYSIVCALISTFTIAAISGERLFEGNGLGGKFYIGFNGGILYKNYYSSTVLAAFMGLFIFSKYRKEHGQRIQVTYIAMIALLAAIFMASSNGTLLILFSFFVTLYAIENLRKVKQSQKYIIVLGMCVAGLAIFVFLFESIALKNQNYIYRINGLIHYIAKYKGDWFHILFGNGALAYAPGQSYVINITAVTGWDGTLELSWLGILIKNGLIGIIVYLIVFGQMLFKALKQKNIAIKSLSIAIISAILVSSLVETYIQNIHVIFGIYILLLAFGCDTFLKEQ